MTCATCAAEVDARAVVCVHCGGDLVASATPENELTPSSNPQPDADRHLEGLGGWLILVGIGRAIAPFLLLRTMARTNYPALAGAKFQPFLDKHPVYHGLLLFEFATNICYLVLTMALIYLFFKRRRSFPAYMILFSVFQLVAHTADITASHIILHSSKFSPRTIGGIFGTFLAAAIWIPYFLVSRRVKVTFVQ